MEGQDAVKDVWEVLDKIKSFSEKVRNGDWLGITGKPLTDVVAIGIGGSFLGPLFVHTALRCHIILFYTNDIYLLKLHRKAWQLCNCCLQN